jgi:site-specific recombinase XerC
VKQQLAAVRMLLLDWLITGQVLPTNPAAAVRGPKHVVKTGKTPVLEGAEWRKLLKSPSGHEFARSARDRALSRRLPRPRPNRDWPTRRCDGPAPISHCYSSVGRDP